jgi:hypothetical protein
MEKNTIKDGSNSRSAVLCPYCKSKFTTNTEMSKYVDRLHHGYGLLEGDARRW